MQPAPNMRQSELREQVQGLEPSTRRGECNKSLKPTPKMPLWLVVGRPRIGRRASQWVMRRGGLTRCYLPIMSECVVLDKITHPPSV